METNTVEPTEAGISEFIVNNTKAYWAANSQPFMLQDISPSLKLRNVDYKSIIGAETTLKQFVSKLSDQVTLIIDPKHPAKIGLVPNGESFTFEPKTRSVEVTIPVEEVPLQTKRVYKSPRPKFAVLNFLEALSKLTPEELSTVSIPISVLAKIVGTDDEN